MRTGGTRPGRASTDYLYDGVNPVQELSGGTPTANLIAGLGVDELLTRTDSAGARYPLTDALGSVIALTDAAGAVQTQYTYEPFGKTTASGATSSSTYQYTSRENDGTGLYYYRARYYHPGFGRFISEDPIGFAGRAANLYTYAANDPLRFRDPRGLTWETNLRFLWDFLTGGGEANRQYGQGNVETQEMQRSKAAENMREAFVQGGCQSQQGVNYETAQAYRDTVANPGTADWSSTAAQVGGFADASVIDNGDGTVTIVIPNEAGANSFFYHVAPNAPWGSGPLRTISQTFEWKEPAPEACRKG